MDREIIVKAGFVAMDKASGGELTVTEYCAVEMNGSLYMTEGWREKRDANEAAWEGRSWLRKRLGIAPKGWPKPVNEHGGGSPFFGVIGLRANLLGF